MKPRLLVVPHVSAETVAVRELELARRLTAYFDVYCLQWADALAVDAEAERYRRWRQFRTALGSLWESPSNSNGAGGITLLRQPVLQPILLRRLVGNQRALAWSQRWNRRVLDEVVTERGITHLLLATDTFDTPPIRGVKVFHDVVDWFPEERATPQEMAWTRRRLGEMAQASTRLFAVSQPLCRKLREEFGIDAVALPNGADLERLRSVAVSEVEAVRERWGLRGKFVVGYIGNLGAFAGVDFAVRAYRELRRRRPDAVLFLVGPAAPWQDLRASTRGEGMIWTGPVAPVEIAAYVQALDLGLLVQEKSLGTEFAFQMKVIEYSACRKFVVSTPLRTWQQLAWPHVLLTELREELWADAMARAGELQWQAEWDELIEPFDWRRLAEQAARVMLGS